MHIPNFNDFFSLPRDIEERIDAAIGTLNSAGFDPWGLDPKTLKQFAGVGFWFYRNYFRVQASGLANLPRGRVMVVANHSGQLPFDAMMLAMALLSEATPARIPRGMVDYWVPSLPFISDLFSRSGAVVGSPLNCRDLLHNEQCVMVFPEGTRGLGKPYSKKYQLQKFGTGFVRLALEAQSPIIPVSIIGAEDIYPGTINIKFLAKIFGTPYFPFAPQIALLGPIGFFPFPSQIKIRFGKPIIFRGDPDMTEEKINGLVEEVRASIREGFVQR